MSCFHYNGPPGLFLSLNSSDPRWRSRLSASSEQRRSFFYCISVFDAAVGGGAGGGSGGLPPHGTAAVTCWCGQAASPAVSAVSRRAGTRNQRDNTDALTLRWRTTLVRITKKSESTAGHVLSDDELAPVRLLRLRLVRDRRRMPGLVS